MMATDEELRAAWQKVCGSSEAYGIDEDVDAAAKLVDDALDELVALRTWKDRAMPLLTELVGRQTIHDDGSTWCLICYSNVAASNDYTASCAAHKARALLAESEASDG